jgi:quinol monooxygenase YgiN
MYGHIGSMRVKPGHRDEVAARLAAGSEALRSAGCHAYVVAVSDSDPDVVWVTEIWESQEHHAGSLRLPEVQAAIAATMPMLTGDFTGQGTTIVGGLGTPG